MINSSAFQRAALKSESYRVLGLLYLLSALTLFVLVRDLFVGAFLMLIVQFVILGLVIAHEIVMLRAIRTAIKQDRDVAVERWLLNILVESQVPTIALFLLLASGWTSPFQVLVAPAILIYLLFIILSTLRLSPTLSFLTGLLSSVGYLFVVFYVQVRFQNSPDKNAAFPVTVYFSYAGLIFAAGIIAATVASQIRKHVGAALREAELKSKLDQVNHDLDVARSIQQGLLPSDPPTLEKFDVAGWNEPADQTGGDYFDWQLLPDGQLAISLGDATGHGIGPALVSASCRAYARANFLASAGKNGLLDRLNRLLSDDLPTNRFVTFAVAFLDPATSHVKILSAGHGPILWHKYATDEIENIEAQGIPLGMISGITYGGGAKLPLGLGDTLALVTDGIYEWENPEGEQFGLKRLESVIRESRNCSAEDLIANLRSSVANFCRGTEQKDDLTAVVLKRKLEPS